MANAFLIDALGDRIDNAQTPHEVLGLDRSASGEEIRAAYIYLAKIFHPDNAGDPQTAEIRFKKVSEAYEELKSSYRFSFSPKSQRSQQARGRLAPYAIFIIGFFFVAPATILIATRNDQSNTRVEVVSLPKVQDALTPPEKPRLAVPEPAEQKQEESPQTAAIEPAKEQAVVSEAVVASAAALPSEAVNPPEVVQSEAERPAKVAIEVPKLEEQTKLAAVAEVPPASPAPSPAAEVSEKPSEPSTPSETKSELALAPSPPVPAPPQAAPAEPKIAAAAPVTAKENPFVPSIRAVPRTKSNVAAQIIPKVKPVREDRQVSVGERPRPGFNSSRLQDILAGGL